MVYLGKKQFSLMLQLPEGYNFCEHSATLFQPCILSRRVDLIVFWAAKRLRMNVLLKNLHLFLFYSNFCYCDFCYCDFCYCDLVVTVTHIFIQIRGRSQFTYYVITFCLFLDPLPPSVIKFGIGQSKNYISVIIPKPPPPW